MQTVARYLIENVVIAYINGYNGRNSKVYDRRLKVYKGVSNPITFVFKNEDQVIQNITSKEFEFELIDSKNNKSVVKKTLTLVDDGSTVSTKGKATVTLTAGDLLDLDSGFYNYSVREVSIGDDSTVTYTVTYSNTSYTTEGSIEVLDGAFPTFVPSVEIITWPVTTGPYSKTSAYKDAKPGLNNNNTLHTIAVYTNGFSGTFKIQGTLSTTAVQDSDFADVTATGQSNPITFTNSTGVTYYNFTGAWQNVRFSWQNSGSNTGVIDKILYRQ
jgi:hypothetical protein